MPAAFGFLLPLIAGLTVIATFWVCYRILAASDEQTGREKAVSIAFAMAAWLVIQAGSGLLFINAPAADQRSIPWLLLDTAPGLGLAIVLFARTPIRILLSELPLIKVVKLQILRVPVIAIWWGGELLSGNNDLCMLIFLINVTIGISASATKYMLHNNRLLLLGCMVTGLVAWIALLLFYSGEITVERNALLLGFPFNWLLSFVWPILLLGNLISIGQLTRRKM